MDRLLVVVLVGSHRELARGYEQHFCAVVALDHLRRADRLDVDHDFAARIVGDDDLARPGSRSSGSHMASTSRRRGRISAFSSRAIRVTPNSCHARASARSWVSAYRSPVPMTCFGGRSGRQVIRRAGRVSAKKTSRISRDYSKRSRCCVPRSLLRFSPISSEFPRGE